MAKLAEQSWRPFIAIELPPDIRAAVMNHIQFLRREFPDAKASWTREENIHLTLKFLGDTPVAKAESVSQALLKAAGTTGPFNLLIANAGTFPPRGKPSVLWIGIEDPTTRLHKLHEAVENE